MASKRKITMTKPQFGNNRPFSLKATRRMWKPNLQYKRLFVPELGEIIRVRVTAKELKTIDKIGLAGFLKKQGKTIKDIL